MKVNGIDNIIEFKKLSELSPGDTFLYESEVYMVTNSVNYIISTKNNNIVVVDLNSGRIHQFSNDTQVISVEANVQFYVSIIGR